MTNDLESALREALTNARTWFSQIADNASDPSEPVADNGATVWDAVRDFCVQRARDIDAALSAAAEQWPQFLRLRDLESALREAREEIAIQRCHYAVSTVAWERSGKLLDRIDDVLSAAPGEARGDEPWRRCSSTHCERRQECASPSDCIVKSRPSPSEAPNVADVLRAKTCALNGALDAIIQLRARIAELEKERDSARAEIASLEQTLDAYQNDMREGT